MISNTILQELVAQKFLDAAVAEKVDEESKQTGRDIEDILFSRNLVAPEPVLKIKSKLLKIPYKRVNFETIDKKIFSLISPDTILTYKIFPISREKDTIVFGVVDPNDLRVKEVLHFLGRQLKSNIAIYLVSSADLENALKIFSPYKETVRQIIENMGVQRGEGLVGAQKISSLESINDVVKADEAPVIKLVAALLKDAVGSKASDMHIEPSRKNVRIRFRIDGELHEIQQFPLELHSALIARIKVLSDLRLDENRIPQDGRFRTLIFEREIDFRIATFPTPFGEKVVLRVLDPTSGVRTLDDIGLADFHKALLQEAMDKPFGMLLSTGPTGSGKTTTLYAMMQILNTEDVNIVSLEDPVEYSMPGVNQSQVRPEIGYDFASGLRQILRQDPDIIMVGEIRDNETAGLAVHAALTGHLVLSTLHTNNATGVLPRLADMKIEPFLLPSTLNLMMAQRLLPRLCQVCKKPQVVSSDLEKIIQKELEALPKSIQNKYSFKSPYTTFKAIGCTACRNKGTIGRIAIVEMLKMTSELGQAIAKGINEEAIVAEAGRQGMVTLRQDGILKALQGLFSLESVLRETEEI